MFRREVAFNEKLLALRDKKLSVVKTISTLQYEFYTIHSILQITADPPLAFSVHMDPEEFPEA